MRKILPLLLVLSLASNVYAQEATINAPIARNSVGKVKIDSLSLTRVPTNSVVVTLVYQDSSNADILNHGLVTTITIPSTTPCTTTIDGYFTAVNSPRGSETGIAARRHQFRALGYLSDQSCFPAAITLVP